MGQQPGCVKLARRSVKQNIISFFRQNASLSADEGRSTSTDRKECKASAIQTLVKDSPIGKTKTNLLVENLLNFFNHAQFHRFSQTEKVPARVHVPQRSNVHRLGHERAPEVGLDIGESEESFKLRYKVNSTTKAHAFSGGLVNRR